MTTESTRSTMLVIVGVATIWLWAGGAALNYVRPSLAPYLLASGVVFVLLGLLPPAGLLARRRPASGPASQSHAPGHPGGNPAPDRRVHLDPTRRLERGPRIGPPDGPHLGHDDEDHQHGRAWVGPLLLVPVLVVVLIQPAALGSSAVSSRTAVPTGGDGVFAPLDPPVRGAVPMTMAEFVTRALRDRGQSLDGVRVRLLGFTTPDAAGGYRLTRFVIFCCAADAEALQVVVQGDPEQRPADQWLEVEGTWVPAPVADIEDPNPPPPALTADAVRPIDAPERPYELTLEFSG